MAQLNKRNRAQRRLAEQISALQIESVTHTRLSGPLPPPEALASYNQIIPGLSDRIVKMAEAEGQHRRTLESQLLTAQIEDAKTYRVIEQRGQICGLAVAVTTIVGG